MHRDLDEGSAGIIDFLVQVATLAKKLGLDVSTGARWYHAGATAWMCGDGQRLVQLNLEVETENSRVALDAALRGEYTLPG
jgi:hypothetical protein